MAAAASVAALAVNGAVRMAGTTSQAYLERSRVKDPKDLIADMCRQLCNLGWVSRRGGSITLKVHDDSIPKHQQLIVMSRSGVQNERMVSEDMYMKSPSGSILSAPLAKPYPHSHKTPKCSDCAPLFMKIEAYPKTTAVLVRNHGIYLWGDSWISAKTKAECSHYLFDAAIRIHQLGMYCPTPAYGPFPSFSRFLGGDRSTLMPAKAGSLTSNNSIEPAPRCIVLDIEGTTTPISFVSDVLFPYAHDNVGRHLDTTYDSKETQDDIMCLRSQILDDLEQGVDGAVPIPSSEAAKEEVIAALVTNVEAMISADRKITALKQLQGHIWQTGFQNNELEGVVFDDVPETLEKWHALGIKVYIYSSGSRLAQRLIFGKTNYGDLRKYLCGFFDTTVGNKKETSSYIQISESLGVDEPSEVLFVTDVLQEAGAAKAAGLEVIISIRPGNGPLPERHGFKTIKSFSEI